LVITVQREPRSHSAVLLAHIAVYSCWLQQIIAQNVLLENSARVEVLLLLKVTAMVVTFVEVDP
jgi:hypothetical protein